MQTITFKRILPFIILLIVVIIFIITLSRCSVFSRATDTPTPTHSNTPSSTPTNPPTETIAPSSTATSSPTYSPTPAYTAQVTALLLNARSGPATTFEILAEIPLNTVLTVLARSSDSEWFYIILPDSGINAWVWRGGLSYDFNVDVLPAFNETPTPTATTATSYGSAILAPPNLKNISPSATGNPSRSWLSLISFCFLLLIMLIAKTSTARIRQFDDNKSLPRLIQLIFSLF